MYVLHIRMVTSTTAAATLPTVPTALHFRSPDIRYTTFWWVDISGAPDSYLHNDVSYSYGI